MPEWMIAPPASFNETADELNVEAVKGSDFWRKTHYGFIHDNGHLYAEAVTGNFVMQVTFSQLYQ